MTTSNTKLNSSRLFLAKVRGGDYAHAGGEEAIDQILSKVRSLDPTIDKKPALDVGSGFGGTANYLYYNGFQQIQGIDIDAAAVKYAKAKYPLIPFSCGDALDIDKFYTPLSFFFVYMLNVFYAIKDKETLLKQLASLTVKGGLIAIFDYAQLSENTSLDLIDLANKPMYPLSLDTIHSTLKNSGWEVLETIDMTNDYLRWYHEFSKKLFTPDIHIQEEFTTDDIQKVTRTLSYINELLDKGHLKGTVIYARKL